MTYKGKLDKKNHVNMSEISKTRDLFYRSNTKYLGELSVIFRLSMDRYVNQIYLVVIPGH